jgi:CRISPR-associated protein (TIGR03986 family)
MAEFYNPYQFIPVTGKIENKPTPTTKYCELKNTHARHDYWVKDSYSGRLVCELVTETPTVVGVEQNPGTNDNPGVVKPYKDIDGNHALPANSLRGMISSVAETISQSSLRVLNQSSYSVRKDYKNGLSAIGVLINDKDNKGHFMIKPVTLPTVMLNNGMDQKWQKVFGETFNLQDWLCVYIDGYETVNDRQSYIDESFLEKNKPDCFFPKQGDKKRFYAKLNDLSSIDIRKVRDDTFSDVLKIKTQETERNKFYFLLGQHLRKEENNLISESEFNGLPDDEKKEYTPGILHVFGIDSREDQIPKGKKHEKFLPIPEDKNFRLIKVPKEVFNKFVDICKERKEASKNETNEAKKLPFLPKGYKQNKESKGRDYWLPEHGELVYFDVDHTGQVSEISYSSIWRRALEGDIYQSFAEISRNTLPWGNQLRNPENSGLTPAELMFGVVAENKVDESPNSYNLASRIRFSDAKPAGKITLGSDVILKILASPKPPSPAMYFCGNGNYVKKESLKLTQNKPNGRKVYLHHPQEIIDKEKWKTQQSNDNLKQKLRVSPIPANTTFYYHIDFNNLSRDELSLLVKSLDPDARYCHRLGLGKPLGLGSVNNKIAGLFLSNRADWYESIDSQRYAEAKAYMKWGNQLTILYPKEAQALEHSKRIELEFSETLIDKNTLEKLILLGDRNNMAGATVSYPYSHSAGQRANQEGEGFKWFVNNDDKTSNHKTLNAVSAEIPKLNSN